MYFPFFAHVKVAHPIQILDCVLEFRIYGGPFPRFNGGFKIHAFCLELILFIESGHIPCYTMILESTSRGRI